MSKKAQTTAAEAVVETSAEVSKENAEAPKTVTITAEEFEALKALAADVKLMKQQLASEERQKSISDIARERELAMIEQIEAANAEAEEEVEYMVSTGSLLSNKNIEVSINGKQYLIPRGSVQKMPRKVMEVIENSIKQRNISFGLQEQMKDSYEAQSVNQSPGGFAVAL